MAVFGLVCAPTLSHALAAWQGQSAWVEVCSAQGTRRILAEPAGQAVSPGADLLHHLSHCPMCGLAGTGLAPAPVAHTAVPSPLGSAVRVARSIAAAPALVPRHDARPRAPPVAA